jgi:hypothetical protein
MVFGDSSKHNRSYMPDMYNLVWDWMGMKISITKVEISQNPEKQANFPVYF